MQADIAAGLGGNVSTVTRGHFYGAPLLAKFNLAIHNLQACAPGVCLNRKLSAIHRGRCRRGLDFETAAPADHVLYAGDNLATIQP